MCLEVYNAEYHQRFVDRAATELGKQIYASRWNFVERHCHGQLKLLDWGCASGAFHKSSTNGFQCDGYDINPHTKFDKQPNPMKQYDIMTFWDSLEHMPNFARVIGIFAPKWIFLSTPNLEVVNFDIKKWRHYRPGEHIFYFDQHSLKFIFDSFGYDIKEINYEEGALRDPQCPQAIISVALARR